MLNLSIPPEALKPLVRDIVAEAIAQMEAARAAVPDGKLAYSEPEAAALLGLRVHQLRDERRRGRIQASVIVGRRVRYQRDDLLTYLRERRPTP